MREYNERYNKTAPLKTKQMSLHGDIVPEATTSVPASSDKMEISARLKKNFRIHFPTNATVTASKGGPQVSLLSREDAG
jgi:hypothetical protein